MYDVMNGIGAHEIVIETPNHAEELAMMPVSHISDVLWTWHDRMLDLAHDGRFRFVMVFKNKGARAGAMLAHPHSQIMALPVVPLHVQEELTGALDYYKYRDRCVFCDLITQELADRRRVIEDTDRFVTVVPFAQRFPFETWILPKNHESEYARLGSTDVGELSTVLKRTLQRCLRHSATRRTILFCIRRLSIWTPYLRITGTLRSSLESHTRAGLSEVPGFTSTLRFPRRLHSICETSNSRKGGAWR